MAGRNWIRTVAGKKPESAAHVAARSAIARYTGLTSRESDAIYRFVHKLVRADEWKYIYEVTPLALGSTNGLVGMKGNHNGTASGSPTWGRGVALAVADYIDVGYSPTDIGGTERGYQVGAYSSALSDNGTANASLFGSNDGSAFSATKCTYRGSDTEDFVCMVNSAWASQSPIPTGALSTFQGELVTVGGVSGGNGEAAFLYAGSNQQTGTITDAAYANNNALHIFVGGINNDGGGLADGMAMTSELFYSSIEGLNYNLFRNAVIAFLQEVGAA